MKIPRLVMLPISSICLICLYILRTNLKKKTLCFVGDLDITRNSSVVYTRWGKKNCSSGAELVFSGKMITNWKQIFLQWSV